MVILAQCALNQRSHKKHNLNGTRLLFIGYMRAVFPNVKILITYTDIFGK